MTLNYDRHKQAAIVFAFTGLLLLLTMSGQSFSQLNSTNANITTSIKEPALTGTYHLSYTKIGGQAHIDELYSYNILNHELIFVNLNDNVTKKKVLSDSDIKELDNIFYEVNFLRDVPGNLKLIDISSCRDCVQYGLSFAFVDFEKWVPLSENVFWNDATTNGTESILKIASLVERLSS